MRLTFLLCLLPCFLWAKPEHACLRMKTGDSSGTGFILKDDQGFHLVTNQHVIDGPVPHSYLLADQTQVKPLTGWLPIDRDIAVFDLPDTYEHYFELEPDIDDVALGEEVIVYGNSLGEGMRISTATVVHKTADTIEISGGIVHGNSGGPILRKSTGKLLAVSTYMEYRSKKPATIYDYIDEVGLPEVRFFGVRIDTIKDKQPFDLRRFLAVRNQEEADSKQLEQALILVSLLYQKFVDPYDPEVKSWAEKATYQHKQTMSILQESSFYKGTYNSFTKEAFIKSANTFFGLNTKPDCYIHRQVYEDLQQRRDSLWAFYIQMLSNIRVR